MYRYNRSLAILTVILLGACAGTETLVRSPVVDLNSVQMSSLSFSGQTFVLGFDISNPNPFPLPVKSIRYNVQLGEQRLASGETQGAFNVPASGNGQFAISVDLDMLQQTSQLSSLLRSGLQKSIEYELHGSLHVDIPFTQPIPFSNSGVIQVANGL